MSNSWTTSPWPERSWSAAMRAAEPAPRKPSRAWMRIGPLPSRGVSSGSRRGSHFIAMVNHSPVGAIPRQRGERVVGDGLRRQAEPLEDDVALGMVEELLLHAVHADRHVMARIAYGLRERGPDTAVATVVLDRDDEAVAGGQLDQCGVDRLDPARVDDRH